MFYAYTHKIFKLKSFIFYFNLPAIVYRLFYFIISIPLSPVFGHYAIKYVERQELKVRIILTSVFFRIKLLKNTLCHPNSHLSPN